MLRWTAESRGDGEVVVTFEGEVTENVDFESLPHRSSEQLVLDLSGVRRLNSQGVHGFLQFLRELSEDGLITAERCSPAIIMQLNMLPSMAGLVTVRSLYVPMECDRCNLEREVLLEIPRGQRTVPALPTTRCSKCGDAMTLAEVPERYFAFLAC